MSEKAITQNLFINVSNLLTVSRRCQKQWLTARTPDNTLALVQGLEQQTLLLSPLIAAWTVAGLRKLFKHQQVFNDLYHYSYSYSFDVFNIGKGHRPATIQDKNINFN